MTTDRKKAKARRAEGKRNLIRTSRDFGRTVYIASDMSKSSGPPQRFVVRPYA
jgi:hypothetical protein